MQLITATKQVDYFPIHCETLTFIARSQSIAKVNGEHVFNGLLTVTNQKGEICICNLVATQAHFQFKLALKCMHESLDLYGQKQPELFYTHNMSDKSFLESLFPFLHADVKPIDKYSHLEPFLLLADVKVCVYNNEQSINAALSMIINDVPEEESDPELALGYDSEWNFIISDNGRHECGEITIIQIAYQEQVYILQVRILGSIINVLVCLLTSYLFCKGQRNGGMSEATTETSRHSPKPPCTKGWTDGQQ